MYYYYSYHFHKYYYIKLDYPLIVIDTPGLLSPPLPAPHPVYSNVYTRLWSKVRKPKINNSALQDTSGGRGFFRVDVSTRDLTVQTLDLVTISLIVSATDNTGGCLSILG